MLTISHGEIIFAFPRLMIRSCYVVASEVINEIERDMLKIYWHVKNVSQKIEQWHKEEIVNQ